MGYYTLNERKVMKLSQKAKKNFEEDNEFYIHIGKKIKQARLDREIYVQNFDEKLDVDGYYIKKPATQQILAKALKTKKDVLTGTPILVNINSNPGAMA